MPAGRMYRYRPKKKRTAKKVQKVEIVKHRKKRSDPVVSKIFPQQKIVKMRFCTTVTIDSTGSTVSVAQFRCNSINDPDAALGGKRPMGHDQWATWYNHYVVLGARITFKLFPSTNTTNIPNAVGVYLSDDTSIPTAFDSLVMQGRGMYKIVPTAQSSGGVYTFYQKYSTKRFFNVTDVKDNTDRLGASFGSNPSEEAYFNIWCQPVDKLTNTGGFTGLATIDYIVALSEPKDIPDSV